jgi:cell division protein FtsB
MARKKFNFSKWVKKIRKGQVHPLLKNRYFITVMGFLFWMLFFDHNGVISQIKLRHQIWEQNSKIAFYTRELKIINKEKGELFGTPESLEKFAREKYMMKKDNEDVYVVVDEGKK